MPQRYKSFRGNYRLATCRITGTGRQAFEADVDSISDNLTKD